MVIDATITIGNVIEICVLAVGGIGAIVAIKSSVGNMKNDLIDLKVEMKKIGEVLVAQAAADARITATDNRLNNLEQDFRELRHGRGFVVNRSDGGINGEYP